MYIRNDAGFDSVVILRLVKKRRLHINNHVDADQKVNTRRPHKNTYTPLEIHSALKLLCYEVLK